MSQGVAASKSRLGQIFRLRPNRGGRDRLQLFFESTSTDELNWGDNLTVAPNGHLILCEDQYSETVTNHLRGITPDGRVMFVNVFGPTRTLAMTGPWIA